MPAALSAHEHSRPLSLRIKHTTDDDLRKCAEASKMKIGETCRLLLEGSLEMLRQAHDSEGDRLPGIELPKSLEKIAKAQKRTAKKRGRKNEWVADVTPRSVRDETEDNRYLIDAMMTAFYETGSKEMKKSMEAQLVRNNLVHLSHRTKQIFARAGRAATQNRLELDSGETPQDRLELGPEPARRAVAAVKQKTRDEVRENYQKALTALQQIEGEANEAEKEALDASVTQAIKEGEPKDD